MKRPVLFLLVAVILGMAVLIPLSLDHAPQNNSDESSESTFSYPLTEELESAAGHSEIPGIEEYLTPEMGSSSSKPASYSQQSQSSRPQQSISPAASSGSSSSRQAAISSQASSSLIVSRPIQSKPQASAPASSKPSTSAPAGTAISYAEQVVKLVNEERVKAGVSPLSISYPAERAALVRAKEIENQFSHTRPNGSNFSTALTEQGISYRSSGENIAWGQRTPEQVMQSWMNSSGHKANILSSKFTAIGVGYYRNASGVNYWAQLFIG